MQNLSDENEFDIHENEPVGGTHFHINGFALRLVLALRQKRPRKWPIKLFQNGASICIELFKLSKCYF